MIEFFVCLKSFDWATSVIFLDHPQFSFWHCTLHCVLLCATRLLELNLYLKTLVLSFMIKQVEHLWSRRCSGAAESAVLNLITFKRFSNYQQLPENCCEHVECHPHISLQHTTLHSLVTGDSAAKLGIYKLPHYEFEKAHFHKIIEQKKFIWRGVPRGPKNGCWPSNAKVLCAKKSQFKG